MHKLGEGLVVPFFQHFSFPKLGIMIGHILMIFFCCCCLGVLCDSLSAFETSGIEHDIDLRTACLPPVQSCRSTSNSSMPKQSKNNSLPYHTHLLRSPRERQCLFCSTARVEFTPPTRHTLLTSSPSLLLFVLVPSTTRVAGRVGTVQPRCLFHGTMSKRSSGDVLGAPPATATTTPTLLSPPPSRRRALQAIHAGMSGGGGD